MNDISTKIESICEEASHLDGPERKNKLLELMTLDKKRFEYELAKWVVDTPEIFNDLKIIGYPQVPGIMNWFYNRTEKEKMHNAFWQKEEVKEYVDKKSFAKSTNRATILWVEWLLSVCPEEDKVRWLTLDTKLGQLKRSEMNLEDPAQKAKGEQQECGQSEESWT